MYNAGNADMFHLWVVMSIVKNRSGVDSIDLGFRKRFERSRPNGRCRRRPKRLMLAHRPSGLLWGTYA